MEGILRGDLSPLIMKQVELWKQDTSLEDLKASRSFHLSQRLESRASHTVTTWQLDPRRTEK